jgi:glycosyltransferase involved in cell wall biosynthesis
MTIAYLLHTFPSLSETFIAREIEALRRRDFEVQVWAMNAGEGAHALPAENWKNRGAKLAAKIGGPEAQQKYFQEMGARWWRDNAELLRDVQHIHAGWASFPAELAQGAAQIAGLPWSFSGHARDLWVEGRGLDAKLRSARFAAVCTRAGQRLLAQQAPDAAHKVLYAPHGLEMSRFEFLPRTMEMDAPLKILSVGRLVEKKGFVVLLQSCALLQAEQFDFYAVLVGEGAQQGELEQLKMQLGLDERVQLVGAQSGEEVYAGMQEADCLVVPSVVADDGDRDGLPNVLLEAAAVGLPIVATNAGSITDFLDFTIARLCEPGDAEELASALREVRSDAQTTQTLARAARERVENLFDIDQNIEVLVQAFRGTEQ